MQKTLGINGSEAQREQNEKLHRMANLRAKSHLRNSHEVLSSTHMMTPAGNITQLPPIENFYLGMDLRKSGHKSHSESKRNIISDSVM